MAVPPGVPAASLTVQPAMYSPRGSLVASPSHLRFCSSEPNQATGMSARPFTSKDGGESGIDGGDLLGDDLQIDDC